MTSSNSQGIKYSASNIRTDQNLCVIRDNGGKMAKRKVFRKKKEKKERKVEKTMEIRTVELFFFSGETTLQITKQASAVFREKTDLVSSSAASTNFPYKITFMIFCLLTVNRISTLFRDQITLLNYPFRNALTFFHLHFEVTEF